MNWSLLGWKLQISDIMFYNQAIIFLKEKSKIGTTDCKIHERQVLVKGK